MNRQGQENFEEAEIPHNHQTPLLFHASLDNIVSLVPLVKPMLLSSTQAQPCRLEISAEGWSLHVERAGLYAHVDIPRSFFQQYRFHQTTQLDPLLQQQEHQDDIELGLDLIPFIECLNMLAIVNPSSSSSHTDHHHQSSSSSSSTGSSTAILGKITVKSDLSLQIMLDQPGHALTVCNLSTFPSADAMAEYASGGGDAGGVGGGRINDLFLDSNLAASVMIKAAWLKEALTDLDKSAIDVCFQFVPSRAGGGSGVGVGVGGTAASTTNSGSFRVFAQGMSGETEVKYMRDAVEEFFCRQSLARQPRSGGHSHDYELRDEEDDVEIDHNNNGYTFKYNYSMLQSTFKVFSHNAQKVHLKVTDSGAMSMTFMLSTEMKDVNAFAEFLIPPAFSADDEMDADREDAMNR